MLTWVRKNSGLLLWTGALVLLYCMNGQQGRSLCLFRLAGFHSCPGCGLGHAIHEALHGDWRQSVRDHILGIPTTLVLMVQVVKAFYTFIKTRRYGSKNAYDAPPAATR